MATVKTKCPFFELLQFPVFFLRGDVVHGGSWALASLASRSTAQHFTRRSHRQRTAPDLLEIRTCPLQGGYPGLRIQEGAIRTRWPWRLRRRPDPGPVIWLVSSPRLYHDRLSVDMSCMHLRVGRPQAILCPYPAWQP